MFNLSFETSKFPGKWKEVTLIPLFNRGNTSDVSNYRPVSLLPIPGKIIKRVVHAKVTMFLDQAEVISDKQGGFRKGFSTMSSVADLTDTLYNNINNGDVTVAALVDLRKAFDTVNHGILMRKLDCYGIRGESVDWCRNYLSCRRQKTLANGIMSEPNLISCGVPQGSVLGPLFFILYVNYMQQALKSSKLQLYADDTVLFSSGSNANDAASKLQPELMRFSRWCAGNKLTLNVKNTKVMVFGTRSKVKKSRDVKVCIDNKQLQLVPSYKYLGMTLDSTLNLKYHVNTLINSIVFKTMILSKIRKYLRIDSCG